MSFQCYPDHRNIHSFPTRRSSDLANGIGYASFTFQVQDDGGIANGGVDLDQSANTMTVDVTSVKDGQSISLDSSEKVNSYAGVYSTKKTTAISAGPANESSQTVSF